MKNNLGNISIIIICLTACLVLGSCHSLDTTPKDTFAGNWQGDGTDSRGNYYTYFAKVVPLGDNRYRILILESLDYTDDPLHVMEGTLTGNDFTYTADEGQYTGGGKLENNTFTGHYEGPVDGKFQMQPIKGEQLN